MNKLNLLKSIPLIIAICFLISLLLGALILWPRLQDLKKIQASLRDVSSELQYQEQYFSQLAEIQNKLGKYEEKLSKIDSALPDNPSLPALLNFLQKASAQSGLVLKGISPFTVSSAGNNPNLRKTQFSLELSGSYSSFKEFLSTIEKSARLIEVENISFSAPKEGDTFTFNLRIKVYSY